MGFVENVNNVANNASNINIVAGLADDIAILTPISDNISIVASIYTDVTAVAGIESEVSTVAGNIDNINSYFKINLGAKVSDPLVRNDGSALEEGDFYFDSTLKVLKYYDGTTWQVSTSNVTDTSENTFTNKTMDSITNYIGANHIHYPIRNDSGAEISEGTVITGSETQPGTDYILVKPRTSANETALGITHSTLADNSTGLAINTGVCAGHVDTSSWDENTILYPDTNGGLTDIKPTSGYYQACAVVTRSHATQGTMLVEFTEPKKVNWDDRYYTEAETDDLLDQKADIGLLSSDISLYPTTASGDFTYNKLVTSTEDVDYDDPAVDVATAAISGADQLIGDLIAPADLFTGNPGVINIPTIGNIKRDSGGVDTYASFYFKLFKRDLGGTETLLSTSSTTDVVTSATYVQFNATALLDNGDFISTDRIVLKFYASKVGINADPVYSFQYGGTNPVRTLLPIPVSISLGNYYDKDEINAKPTGQKNLILNPRKSIDQRSSGGGGKIQVIESYMNIGGSHTLSFTGTATATIYEFPTLLADYATTIADGSTNTLASGIATDEVVTPTAGYYIAIEFSTTDFDNVQFEPGTVPTNLEIRHNEQELCSPFYCLAYNLGASNGTLIGNATIGTFSFSVQMRAVPTITKNTEIAAAGYGTTENYAEITIYGGRSSRAATSEVNSGNRFVSVVAADAEIFNTTATYKEDRWFI